MVARALDDGGRARVPDAEPFAGYAADVGLSRGRAVEGDVPDQDVLLGDEARLPRRLDDDLSARKALADVVVRVALEAEGDPPRDEGAEALACRTDELEVDRVLRKPGRPVALGDLASEYRADDAVYVSDRQGEGYPVPPLDRLLADPEEDAPVEGILEAVILGRGVVPEPVSRHLGKMEDLRVVEVLRLAAGELVVHLEQVASADHLVDGPEAERGHVLPEFRGDEVHEVDDVLGIALESGAKLRVLGGDADGAGVEVAHPHHHAAEGYQGPGGEAEFLGAEEGGYRDVPAREELAVGFDDDPAPKIVEQQGLVSLGEAELPGKSRVPDG